MIGNKDKSKYIPRTISLPEDLWDQIDALAAVNMCSRSTLVRVALLTYLKELENEE